MNESKMQTNSVFSVRLVIADFYMEKPVSGFDPCYSEFRGREIKRVPIIRVFGSNADGLKTCMHIHGVFPYFYIPYEAKEFESLNKAIYHIATNVDKAINISLGQACSASQHVFKVQQVKGIPFYGYHRGEHQFLKIYMFNPRFVRRAANLLQSGAVMNKNFHPYESHVPYILQFMIDYNLYGMSFIHVPLEIVKFRQVADNILTKGDPLLELREQQVLDQIVPKKQSICALEVDIGSNFILNRFQLANYGQNNENSNPGIEAIWNDERLRRQKMNVQLEGKKVPTPEIPVSQERPDLLPTESEIFHRTALLSKLMDLDLSAKISDTTVDQSLNSNLASFALDESTGKDRRRTFNLSKIIGNAIYPEECTTNENLIDASFIENHVSNNSSSTLKAGKTSSTVDGVERGDSIFWDDTIVDEELRKTEPPKGSHVNLCKEDLELLDILKQLEEEEDNENQIDLDSSLAPLTQTHKHFEPSPDLLDKQVAAAAMSQPLSDSDNESDASENDKLHDFSIVLEDMDELILKFTPSQRKENGNEKSELPQVDGADDLLPKTPSKRASRASANATNSKKTPPRTPKPPNRLNLSPKRSPRTPKSSISNKYAPLPLKINSKRNEQTTACANEVMPGGNSGLKDLELGSHDTKRTPIRRSRKGMDMDKTHITCELTPRRRKSERILKVYSINENDSKKDEPQTINTQAQYQYLETTSTTKQSTPDAINNEISSEASKRSINHETAIRKCVVKIRKNTVSNIGKHANTTEEKSNSKITDVIKASYYQQQPLSSKHENCAELYPVNFNVTSIPEKYDEDDDIVASDTEDAPLRIGAKRLRRSFHIAQRRKKLKKDTKLPVNNDNTIETSGPTTKSTETDEDNNDGDDSHIQSFYDISFTEDLSRPLYSGGILHPTPLPIPKKSTSTQPFLEDTNSTPEPVQTYAADTISQSEKDHATSLKFFDTHSNELVQLTPLNLPPTYDEVLAACDKLDIPEYEFPTPFYGDPDDITRRKEVGHMALYIPGNKLNDCDEFQSVLGDELKGLTEWRRQKMLTIGGPSTISMNPKRIREYFAEHKPMKIVPKMCPPTREDAKLWLKACDLLQNAKDSAQDNVDFEESPIKVRRQKITMILNDGVDGDDDGESAISLTLTPPTPVVETKGFSKVSQDNTQKNAGTAEAKKLKSHTKRAKLSLHKKIMKSVSPDIDGHFSSNKTLSATQIENSLALLNMEQLSSSIDSTISSQTVLNAMKRNSFIKELQIKEKSTSHELSFGLNSTSLSTTFGFKVNLENLQQAKSDVECNYITTIILELFVPSRGNLLPDPALDEVRCLFYAIEHRSPMTSQNAANQMSKPVCGCIIVKDIESYNIEENYRMFGTGGYTNISMRFVQTEIEAFESLVELCRHWDPDIYGGYEIETASWGFVLERSKQLGFNIAPLLSRVPSQKVREYIDEDREHFTDLDIEMKLCGRILLDVWRLMRSEIALTSYTFENVMYHILHKRCPAHSHRSLTKWFDVPYTRWIVIDYYIERVCGTLALLEQLDLIGRTSEMAKLIGIQFYEVLSRGSQFRVESMMLRIAKPRNLVPLSPSVQQRAHMRAPEYLPLILEPRSRFYADPVIVLDFQSLYPSMIIAYNYCFSTCLGRVEHLGHSTPFEFGASQLRVSPTLLRRLIDDDLITISPCGVVFVKAAVREGILPRMLSEILDTRQMVKQSMKLDRTNSALQRVLHSRQLGLKLMANVTYGYTAANFSGRMPAVELGDSVVAKGRETLERAIRMVESNEKWRVRVVYGDTDSLFVQVPGRNREQAFKIGEEIAAAVTKVNPKPVKLKLEKVYQPCILQTKKRYVGYMYESMEQREPVYEAKGIETVRRDGCPAVAKMLEKVLRILFETTDVSQIKKYVCRQFSKLLAGRANLQDLIFAKEFRGLNGYKPTACVPALELTRRWIQTDPRHVPRCGERVPFVIVNGPPGVPLIRLVRSPQEVLEDEGLKINAIYYITKAIIPPLNRCLLLIGADVNEWFASLPRKLLIAAPISTANQLINYVATTTNHQSKKSTISQYFSVTNCVTDCGRQTNQGICGECVLRPQRTFVTLHGKIAKIERGYQLTQQICQACCGRAGEIKCCSLDCPVLYVSEVKRRYLKHVEYMRCLLSERF
ncbi:DNA polymerase zeta catalytic subunit isoform X2 [Eurosta solidaginis]|uniref:DNA polymerase zeta catalytic subunit isoform X2 n=1 Tax=Eurosta solidaginis TaxID=178769 RepID=UPI0035311A7E